MGGTKIVQLAPRNGPSYSSSSSCSHLSIPADDAKRGASLHSSATSEAGRSERCPSFSGGGSVPSYPPSSLPVAIFSDRFPQEDPNLLAHPSCRSSLFFFTSPHHVSLLLLFVSQRCFPLPLLLLSFYLVHPIMRDERIFIFLLQLPPRPPSQSKTPTPGYGGDNKKLCVASTAWSLSQ